ncbi:MAG: response regulator [Schwartzia sp.]|nr:response regulator [Schwartzia sp. (in: firmicutes)]MBR1885728.1 response regulator [Schwartzia sp. (in: firmicutes)]
MTDSLYGGRRPKLLAVDDVDMNLAWLAHVFKSEADVTTKTSGMEALTWLEHNTVDLILLDFRMPGMDGFDVLRVLKHDPHTADIPVIMLTGDIDVQLESKGFLEGVTDFVRKPPLPDVIRQRVRRVLRYEYLQEHLEHEVSRQTAIAARRLEESQQLFREMALALAKTIDAKDTYTHGHSERVATYSRMISERAGDDAEAQERIYYMGLLHDIGKIGVAGTIINKTSRLDDEEFHSIQSHTLIGSEILRNIHQFPDLSIGARSHHERYDGKGYPDKLAGEAIPRAARIIAVADTYDAMTSSRSYRKGLPQDVARAEIEKGKGTQFDPEFADLMIALIDDDKDFILRSQEE